jgi:cobalamin biosynthesis protein CobT
MTEVAAPLDRRTNPGEHDSDSEAEPEETRRDIGEHESDSEAAEEDQDSEGTKKKKKKKVKAAIPLKCSYRQFIELLQEVLTFHAFYQKAWTWHV